MLTPASLKDKNRALIPPRGPSQRAMFGDILWGSALVRFVYVDEAGTSENEPVTIVVGLIVNADEQLMFAESVVEEALGSVPSKLRDGFVSHAMEVWSSPKYRDDWAMSDRLRFLKTMMGLPRRLKLPILLGLVRRSSEVPPEMASKGISRAQYHHILAFWMCVSQADRYMRDHAGLSEVGTVVAEDVPEMRKYLRKLPKMFTDDPTILPPGTLQPTQEEQGLGYIKQSSEVFRISRIRRSIHFVEKQDDPLLQLADACAFGFRRYFSEQQHGRDFVLAILDQEPVLADYSGPCSAVIFIPHDGPRP
jgi:hypothetical protein